MTTRKTPLRAVKSGDAPPKIKRRPRAKTVKSAADSGSRRELLVSLRARIAKDIDSANTPPRDLAALSRRLLEIAREIEAIDAYDGGDDVGQAASTEDGGWRSEAL